ncbi:CGI-121-domain-containing protein [Phlegmacium glaucopus]|nr:CGI-121-domain-containing protein [Phlegmacium glaucopus]
MESLHFPHYKADYSYAHIALFRNVSTSEKLKNRIISASVTQGESGDKEREAVNFVFIDARLITSKLHLQTAISQAILAESQGQLRTKTVHSEVLYYLNPTHNITEAIRRYGISKGNVDVIVVKIGSSELSPAAVEGNMKEVIDGTIVPLLELENVTDWSSVKKYHKLNGEAAIKGSKEREIIDNIVVSSVAMKSVMS